MQLRVNIGWVGQSLDYLLPQSRTEMPAKTKDLRLDTSHGQSKFIGDSAIGVHLFIISLY
jgi:hypothetical protein